MKNNIFKGLLLCGTVAALTGCSENSWNKDYLDGFEEPTITNVQSVEYTLTASDYTSIANNKTNKTIAEAAGLADQLKSTGNLGYFYHGIDPATYVPAFLASSAFPYFTLDTGSAVKLTYKAAEGVKYPGGYVSPGSYIVTDEDYQSIWDSGDNYVDCFAPSKVPSRYIPNLLKKAIADPQEGQCVIVNYEVSQQEPVFGSVGDEPGKEFVLSSVISSIVDGETYDINGIVTAIGSRGYVITDASGSIMVYVAKDFDASLYKIGDQMVLNATGGSYNNGYQLTRNEEKVVGNQAYTYPAPEKLTGASMDALNAELLADKNKKIYATYAQVEATVSVSGNYYNFIVDGAESSQGSVYYATPAIQEKVAALNGSKAVIRGYLVGRSGKLYLNMMVTDIEPLSRASKAMASRAVTLATENVNVMYTYSGSSWSVAPSATVLGGADYEAMGVTSLSIDDARRLIPVYLRGKYPYAQPDDKLYVYFNNGSGFAHTLWIYDGAEWQYQDGVATVTAQYVKSNGKWVYDPSVTITLPYARNTPPSSTYYQACVDWVYENIDRPLGSTSITSGIGYVTSYGNNEYYSGASAYYGNVDIRANKARDQYPEGWGSMSDEEIVAAMKKHFELEVMPGALHMLHGDATPIPGFDVIYTINFTAYDGNSTEETIRFKVVEKGVFEFIDCTWNGSAE